MTVETPGRVRSFLRLVVIEHSVFALPFAYLSALTAMLVARPCQAQSLFPYGSRGHGLQFFSLEQYDRLCSSVDWQRLLVLTVAMVAARTLAMAANRVIDRQIDALNPRTQHRELVTGAVSVSTATRGAVVALVVFLVACAALGPLPLVLAPLAVVPLVVYPYAKRFTDYPQAVLGVAQAIGPIGAWIAVTGHWSWTAVVLGLAVGTWIGGFDLVYASQDAELDRTIGVRSVPARFGVANALRASSLVHVLTFGLLVWFGLLTGAGAFWYVGLALTAAAFVYEHRIVSADDLSRVNRSFFTTNGFVGIGLFLFGLVDLVVRGLHL